MQVEEQLCDYKILRKENIEIEKEKLPENVQATIIKIIKNEGYTNYSIDLKNISTNGGNYLGLLYVVDVKGKTASGFKETNLFVKLIIRNCENVTFFSVQDVYLSEIYYYNELASIYNELQDDAAVPDQNRFNIVRCYGTSGAEAIVLENVVKKGYKTLYRMDVPSIEFINLSVIELAKMHAMSFVLKLKRPQYCKDNITSRKYLLNLNEDFRSYFKDSSVATAMEHLSDESRNIIEKYVPKLLDVTFEILNDRSSRSCCLCHGDFRVNNILAKEIDGVVTDIIPVDYQTIYYGCPVNDLIYFIALSTDREFRRKHLENIKNLYYDTLESFLKYFNLDCELMFSREEFKSIYNKNWPWGLYTCIMVYPFLFADEENVPEINSESFLKSKVKVTAEYKVRLQEAVDEYIEMGCFD